MQDMKKQAKIDVLKELMQLAKDTMRNKTKSGMDEMKAQKVTVAAPDKESLLAGLEKAEDVLESSMPEEMMEDSEEMSDKPSMEDFMSKHMEDDKPMLSDVVEDSEMEDAKPSYMEDEEEDSIFASKKPKKKMMDEE